MEKLTSSSISVIIPVYNGGEIFKQCLSSLAAATPPPLEIIVVSDGDTDNSWQVAEKFGAKVLRIAERGGPGRARNLGASIAKGEILFFVDADVAVGLDTIEQVALILDNNTELAAIIGSYDEEPGANNFLSQYKNLFHHYTHQTAREEASTFWGACGAIRREIFLKINGFKEDQLWVEDIELGYRLKQLGYKIRLCKTLQVKHLKHWGVASLLKADFCHRALPWTKLILRDRQLINDLNLQMSSRVSTLLTYILLITLIAAIWWSMALPIAFLLTLIFLWINAPVYCFFQRQRGFWFAIQTIPWHWFYYFYSGLAFAIGTAYYLFWRLQPVKTVNSKIGDKIGKMDEKSITS